MPKKEAVSRREFLEKSGLAVGAVAAMPALPPRAADRRDGRARSCRTASLGRTGASVSILAMGCGSRFLMYPADQASAVLEKAIGLGIDYLDTAVGYGDGESETRLGRVMATRRKDVFLATKVPTRARTRDAALKEVEASLKRLQTDHLDLLHLHSLGDEADLAKIEAPDGAIKALYELREQKVTRFIGMTSHTDGAVMAKAIERNDLDCVQMAMNPARAARFEELALPAANKKNLGVILMKVTGQDKLHGGRRGRRRLAPALRLEPADLDRGLRHAEARVPRGERGHGEGVRRRPCRPPRWRSCGSSWPAARSCSSSSSPTTTTGAGRRRAARAPHRRGRLRRPGALRGASARSSGRAAAPPPRPRNARASARRGHRDLPRREPDAVHGPAPPRRGADRQQADGRGERQQDRPPRPAPRQQQVRDEQEPQRGHRVPPEQDARQHRLHDPHRRGRARRPASPATAPAAGSPRRGRRATASRRRGRRPRTSAAPRPGRAAPARARARRRGRRAPSARARAASSLSAVSDGLW